MECKGYRKKIKELENDHRDLLVLIDTLQRCLERSENVLNGHEKYDYVFAPSAKWALKWKNGDK